MLSIFKWREVEAAGDFEYFIRNSEKSKLTKIWEAMSRTKINHNKKKKQPGDTRRMQGNQGSNRRNQQRMTEKEVLKYWKVEC